MAMGSIRTWGEKRYQKTPQGWKKLAEKEKKREAKHTEKRLKQFHKEMRAEHGGGWVGEVMLRGKMKLVEALEKRGKARITRADGHFKVMFMKSDDELEKAKYTKRWKGKDGKWKYQYGTPKGRKKGTAEKQPKAKESIVTSTSEGYAELKESKLVDILSGWGIHLDPSDINYDGKTIHFAVNGLAMDGEIGVEEWYSAVDELRAMPGVVDVDPSTSSYTMDIEFDKELE